MVENAVHGFFSYLNLQRRFSPLTANSYRSDLLQFFSFLDSEIHGWTLETVTHHHIRSYIAHLMDGGIMASSVNRKISAFRSFFRYLVRSGQLAHNPAQKIKGPKAPKKLPVFVDEDKIAGLFSEYRFKDGFEGERDKLILELLYSTGIRRAELLALKESDIDLYSSELRVLGKRNKERIIPFSVELKRSLQSYMQLKSSEGLSDPALFVSLKNKPLSAGQVTRMVRLALSGVTSNLKKSPHVLRHTFATHMLNGGADINAVKELLGHANLSATQIYTHNTIEKLKKSYNQAHPRSGS
jgi:integrase/recombinase XerC